MTTIVRSRSASTPRARRQPSTHSLTATVLTAAVFLYCVMPLFWLLVSATKSGSDLFSSFALWFKHPTSFFSNVHDVFTYNDGIYLRWLGNTLLYAGVSAIGASILAVMSGYAFAKFDFRGKSLLWASVLSSIMVPTTALVIPLYLMMSKIHMLDTIWAFILPSLVSPFGIYLMRVYAESSVPDEVIEAARVDGAGELRTLVSVVARMLTPGFVTVLLFNLVASWNNFFLPLVVFSDQNKYPLTVGLAVLNGSTQNSGAKSVNPIIITGSLLAVLPLILAFIFLQRYWRSGLNLGSIR